MFINFNNVRIAALACAVPSHTQYIDESPEREDAARTKTFVKNTGIKQRRISVTGQTSLDLCRDSAKKALEKAGWDTKSVDAIVFVTQFPDYWRPGNGCLLQYVLGMRTDSMSFDINLGCSAFPYGLYVGCSMLQAPNVKRVIVAMSDTQWGEYMSIDALRADNSFIHGEGGAVMLLEKHSNSPEIKGKNWTDGSGYKYLHAFGGARNFSHSAHAERETVVPSGDILRPGGKGYMDGTAIMSFTTTTVVDSIKEFIQHSNKDINSYDGVVLHQANLQILKTMAKRLKLDTERMPLTLEKYANTSAASVVLTICDAYAGSVNDLHLLAAGFGVGLSWGVWDFHVSPSAIVPIFDCADVFEEGKYRDVE